MEKWASKVINFKNLKLSVDPSWCMKNEETSRKLKRYPVCVTSHDRSCSCTSGIFRRLYQSPGMVQLINLPKELFCNGSMPWCWHLSVICAVPCCWTFRWSVSLWLEKLHSFVLSYELYMSKTLSTARIACISQATQQLQQDFHRQTWSLLAMLATKCKLKMMKCQNSPKHWIIAPFESSVNNSLIWNLARQGYSRYWLLPSNSAGSEQRAANPAPVPQTYKIHHLWYQSILKVSKFISGASWAHFGSLEACHVFPASSFTSDGPSCKVRQGMLKRSMAWRLHWGR